MNLDVRVPAFACLLLLIPVGAVAEDVLRLPNRGAPALELIAPPPAVDSIWTEKERAATEILSEAERASGPVEEGPIPTVGKLPAEFERQAALLLGGGQMLEEMPDLFVQLVALTRGHVQLITLVPGSEGRKQAEKLLAERNVTAPHMHYVEVAHDSMWTRDYGPMVVQQANGRPAMIDAIYDCADRSGDDAVPFALGRQMKTPVVQAPIWLDGGNLLTNGRGFFLATYELVNRNAGPGVDAFSVRQTLAEMYGAKSIVFLEPLFGEPTGHVDMFATFVSFDTVVVGQLEKDDDRDNARVLDENARRLAAVRLPGGGRLKVIRVPMPKCDDGVWRSYTNVVYANGLVVVPLYPHVDKDRGQKVLETYRRLMPGWRVVGIDAEALAALGGALHCVTMNLGSVSPLPKQHEPRIPKVALPLDKPLDIFQRRRIAGVNVDSSSSN